MKDINDIEIYSFLKCWFYNTREEFEFINSVTGEPVLVKNEGLIFFYRDFFEGISE